MHKMKTPLFIFIALSTLSLSSGQRSPAPVLDTDRNFLRSGTNYYILPVMRGRGGGVKLASRNQTCPQDVVQENNEVNNGLPMTFTPANGGKGSIIREYTDLNIRFSVATICIQSPVWRLEDSGGQQIVSSQGMIGNPGRETIRNWFKIQKHEDGYKIVYCPTVCNACRPYCGDIGSTISKSGRRSLLLSKVPLKVMFKKA